MIAEDIQKEINLLIKELNTVKEQRQTLDKKEDELTDSIILLRSKYLISSDLLSKHEWVYVQEYAHDDVNYIQLKAKTHYWKELEEITGNPRYHWSFVIIKDELKVGGDDGDMCLFIKKDVLQKWVKQLNLKVDVKRIEKSIDENEKEIATRYENIMALKKIKRLANGEMESPNEDPDVCPCWVSPCDPDGHKGTCEGDGGDCRYPGDRKKWEICSRLAKGCNKCGWDKTCDYKNI
jgi:hypothetical protein